MKSIYLDNAATTKMHPSVKKEMAIAEEKYFGNSSSLHKIGRVAKDELDIAREKISKKVNNKNHKLIFTSGGTESNNFALKGLCQADKNKKHIITTKIEHDSILNITKFLEKNGYAVTYLDVDKYGFVKTDALVNALKKDTLLVSVIQGNNEIGTIQNIKEISKIVHDNGTLLHVDACQSFTKHPIDIEKENIDLLTINAHKIYGPKGVGGLFIKEGIKLESLLHGGGHEYKLRSGTVNVPGIIGFSKATEVISEKDISNMTTLRNMLVNGLKDVSDSWLNGSKIDSGKRLCNNANFSFMYAEGEAILLYLDALGISVSTGSACSSNTLEPSHVLKAIGLKQEQTHGTIRFSIGIDNTKEDIKYTIDSVKDVIAKLRNMNPYRYKVK
ncbi:MAG TPA: cysteine desulfurase family protein [Candidatus Diapherotrites archaeon]|jgi:cysteine desulfurase|nr:cysteine desulfurase family protein [Candidatus Diapherotrites archaeon]